MYKLSLQYAHSEQDEFEESTVAADGVLKAFDDFDWMGEVAKVEHFQKFSPTLSVESPDGKLIWVSGVGPGLEFVSEYSFEGAFKRFFGLWKGFGLITVDTQTFVQSEARRALELFVNSRHDELVDLYKKTNRR